MKKINLKELAKLADSEVTWILLPKDLANDGWCTEGVNYISVVSPSTITALVDRIEAAERERDELREQFDKLASAAGWSKEQCEQVGESPFDTVEGLKNAVMDHHHSLIKAEKELKRRDAAAGEPVAVLYRNGDVLTKAECGEYFEICCKVETPLYTAAPPALLPPAVMKHLSDAANTVSEWTHGDEHSCKVSRTALIAAIEALGAQPQKPVICPPVQYLSKYAADDGHCTTGKLVPNKRTELRDTEWREALDAAGVKWEVKK